MVHECIQNDDIFPGIFFSIECWKTFQLEHPQALWILDEKNSSRHDKVQLIWLHVSFLRDITKQEIRRCRDEYLLSSGAFANCVIVPHFVTRGKTSHLLLSLCQFAQFWLDFMRTVWVEHPQLRKKIVSRTLRMTPNCFVLFWQLSDKSTRVSQLFEANACLFFAHPCWLLFNLQQKDV